MNNRPDKVGERAVADGLAVGPRLHVQLHRVKNLPKLIIFHLLGTRKIESSQKI